MMVRLVLRALQVRQAMMAQLVHKALQVLLE
jgi:hypothetical protein